MKVKYKPAQRIVEPPTYSITGLTKDEMDFLRDLMGKFADNPGDGGIKEHFHTKLFCKILRATGDYAVNYSQKYVFSANIGFGGLTLHCKKVG